MILCAALPTCLASSGSRRVEGFASHAAAGPSTRFATRGAAPAASLVREGQTIIHGGLCQLQHTGDPTLSSFSTLPEHADTA